MIKAETVEGINMEFVERLKCDVRSSRYRMADDQRVYVGTITGIRVTKTQIRSGVMMSHGLEWVSCF